MVHQNKSKWLRVVVVVVCLGACSLEELRAEMLQASTANNLQAVSEAPGHFCPSSPMEEVSPFFLSRWRVEHRGRARCLGQTDGRPLKKVSRLEGFHLEPRNVTGSCYLSWASNSKNRHPNQ